jgi:PAS domain S-box-containing protein
MRWLAIGSAIVMLIGLSTVLAVRWTDDDRTAAIARQLGMKIDGFTDLLRSQLQWFDLPPAVLAEARQVTDLLGAPRDPKRRDVANTYLKKFNRAMHASVSYIMDVDGLTLAASNFDAPHSLVGHNYRFRPYFKVALARGVGRYITFGATTHVLGYYVAVPVRSGDAVRGVAIVKYTPATLLTVWHDLDSPIAIADENGVVFASSEPHFRLHTLAALGPLEREMIASQKQYPATAPLTPLPLLAENGTADGALATLNSTELRGGEQAPPQLQRYVIRRRDLADTGWQILGLGNLDATTGATVPIVIVGMLAGALALLLFVQVEQRRASRRTLALNEARLRAILETSPIGASVTTLDGRQLFCSARYCELFGYPRDEIAQIDVGSFYVNPTHRSELLELIERDGLVRDQEAEFRHPNGSCWWGLVSWDRVTYENQTAYVSWCYDITERKRSEAEIGAARDAAEAAYRDLEAAQGSLIQAEKMASLGQLTAGIAHEIKNPLNFVNNFSGLSVELLDELKEAAAPAIDTLDEDKRAAIDEVIAMLSGNLEKIAEHGRRADGIVTSMLEHSRVSSGERRVVDLNAIVDEALNLAYHGARARDTAFHMTLERDLDPTLAPIALAPQEMTRVLLNLIGNGFYAATKRTREAGDGFRPALKVTTREFADAVEVKVRDNGTGIAPEIREKLFQPFFTTKPTGEGTGLGLSISYDIVTQQHGGTIAVDSEPGAYTEFVVRLPRMHRVDAEAAS